ncbi:MAG: hypothetical protein M3Z66_15490 [Chloroflexota bacterium]|nr:hypothetical protein [Chloroflexota bacterium]
MSAVLEAIEGQHALDRVKLFTQELDDSCTGLHWRYDLLSSRHFPVQYYAVALRGFGPDVEEVLVIGIECCDQDEGHNERLVVSASISQEDGAVLAQAPKIEIEMPSPVVFLNDPEWIMRTTHKIQVAFDQMVDWVNEQRTTIEGALT